MKKTAKSIILLSLAYLASPAAYAGEVGASMPSLNSGNSPTPGAPTTVPAPAQAPSTQTSAPPVESAPMAPMGQTTQEPSASSSSAQGTGNAPESAPVLRGTLTKQPAVNENASVESFFQINPQGRNNPESLLMQPPVAQYAKPAKESSVPHDLYRFVWHVLDDAGVPMFFGLGPYIDPTIGQTYIIAAPKLPRAHAVDKQLEKSIITPAAPASTSTTTEPAPEKIPESELEGVPLPEPREDVHEQLP